MICFFGFTFFARYATSSALILQPTRAQNVPHGLDGPAYAALARVEVPAGAGPAAEARRRDIAPGEVGDAGEDGVDVGLDERRARGQDHFGIDEGKRNAVWRSPEKEKARRKKRTRTPQFAFFSSTAFAGRDGGEARRKSAKGGRPKARERKMTTRVLCPKRASAPRCSPNRIAAALPNPLFSSFPIYLNQGAGVFVLLNY